MAHWHVLLRARAVEAQCYVLAAAQCGQHNAPAPRASYGHALAADPWGAVVAEASDPLCEVAEADAALGTGKHVAARLAQASVLLVSVDDGLVARARTALPVAQHARPDLYGAPRAAL